MAELHYQRVWCRTANSFDSLARFTGVTRAPFPRSNVTEQSNHLSGRAIAHGFDTPGFQPAGRQSLEERFAGWRRIRSAKVVVDHNTLGIAWPSLAFDDANRPNISYYDAYPADLKLARLHNGSWQKEVLAVKGAQGLFSTLVFEGGTANLFYYNRQLNETHRLRGSFGSWSNTHIESGGGRYLGATLAPDNDLTYAWFETATATLHVEDL